jgi:hypothetical protein
MVRNSGYSCEGIGNRESIDFRVWGIVNKITPEPNTSNAILAE